MSKKLIARINKAFDKIYAMGDAGLEYLDSHPAIDSTLIEHFYDETLYKLNLVELEQLARSLETVVSESKFDLAV
jgi:hypothetical protein